MCCLFISDTLEEMTHKLTMAEIMVKDALIYRKHKQESPDLIEALISNVPELCLFR